MHKAAGALPLVLHIVSAGVSVLAAILMLKFMFSALRFVFPA